MGNQGAETNQRCREEEEEKNNPRGGNGIQIDHGAETNGAGRKKKRRIIRKVARAYKFAARGGYEQGTGAGLPAPDPLHWPTLCRA